MSDNKKIPEIEKELIDLKLAHSGLRILMKAAVKVSLDKTCCGNCSHMWKPTCFYPDKMAAGIVCEKHEFDGIKYKDRLKELEVSNG